MIAEKGIWQVSSGKGNRVYIRCNDESRIMHPQELCNINGLGMYGHEHLDDLAKAILLFEYEKKKTENNGWNVIKTIEDLPKESGTYLFTSKKQEWLNSTYDYNDVKDGPEWFLRFSHWREVVHVPNPIY